MARKKRNKSKLESFYATVQIMGGLRVEFIPFMAERAERVAVASRVAGQRNGFLTAVFTGEGEYWRVTAKERRRMERAAA